MQYNLIVIRLVRLYCCAVIDYVSVEIRRVPEGTDGENGIEPLH